MVLLRATNHEQSAWKTSDCDRMELEKNPYERTEWLCVCFRMSPYIRIERVSPYVPCNIVHITHMCARCLYNTVSMSMMYMGRWDVKSIV